MNAPAFSTFSAIAEFFVTVGVFYIVLVPTGSTRCTRVLKR